jgi:hypothetical protein
MQEAKQQLDEVRNVGLFLLGFLVGTGLILWGVAAGTIYKTPQPTPTATSTETVFPDLIGAHISNCSFHQWPGQYGKPGFEGVAPFDLGNCIITIPPGNAIIFQAGTTTQTSERIMDFASQQ